MHCKGWKPRFDKLNVTSYTPKQICNRIKMVMRLQRDELPKLAAAFRQAQRDKLRDIHSFTHSFTHCPLHSFN